MDVKTIFFNRDLKEKIYMVQSEGFTSTDESKVRKINRFIYRLKQASRSWNMCFDKMIKIYDFIKNGEELYIYKWTNGSVVIFFILYVNSILLIKNDTPAL